MFQDIFNWFLIVVGILGLILIIVNYLLVESSKMDENVGCAFYHVTTNYYEKFKISKDCSIFSAEAVAILRALAYIDSLDQPKKILIVCDSQSVLKSIQNFYKTKSENYIIYKICDFMCKIN